MAKNVGVRKIEDSLLKSKETAPLQLKRSFKWEENRWKLITPEEFFDVKIGDLWNEEKRLMAVCGYNGKEIYIVCNDTDYKAVKNKYPRSTCIHLNQLLGIWKGCLNNDYFLNALPKIMMTVTTFDGAKVVDVLQA